MACPPQHFDGGHGAKSAFAHPTSSSMINPTPNNRPRAVRRSPCLAQFRLSVGPIIRGAPQPGDVTRRHLIGASAAGVAGALAMSPDSARAAPPASALGRDATQYGVRPNSPDDQTKALQRAIDEAARGQMPLSLPPGIYRTGMLRLQNGSQLIGVRGATKFVFGGSGASMLQSEGAASIGLSGITFDGGTITLPTRRGLVHCIGGRDVRIT